MNDCWDSRCHEEGASFGDIGWCSQRLLEVSPGKDHAEGPKLAFGLLLPAISISLDVELQMHYMRLLQGKLRRNRCFGVEGPWFVRLGRDNSPFANGQPCFVGPIQAELF